MGAALRDFVHDSMRLRDGKDLPARRTVDLASHSIR
jgi:hypothetical protein